MSIPVLIIEAFKSFNSAVHFAEVRCTNVLDRTDLVAVSDTSVAVGDFIRYRCACGFSPPENPIVGVDGVYSVECLESGLFNTPDIPVCVGMFT